jgi:hypothetical protein
VNLGIYSQVTAFSIFANLGISKMTENQILK